MNNHMFAVSPSNFSANAELVRLFGAPLSTNVDRDGNEFVSTIEGVTLPIYATQWHPEKPQFEWWSLEVVNHSTESIVANSWPIRFFVSEARRNNRTFPTAAAEQAALIYNFPVTYTGPVVLDFEQCYFFN